MIDWLDSGHRVQTSHPLRCDEFWAMCNADECSVLARSSVFHSASVSLSLFRFVWADLHRFIIGTSWRVSVGFWREKKWKSIALFFRYKQAGVDWETERNNENILSPYCTCSSIHCCLSFELLSTLLLLSNTAGLSLTLTAAEAADTVTAAFRVWTSRMANILFWKNFGNFK